jgi:methylated-DNA-[protein]-cysteine S-methyltransferase
MRCCDVEELWDELRERRSDPNTAVSVHLRDCPVCRETFRQNDRLLSCLSNLGPANPPADLGKRVLLHVRVSCSEIKRVDSLTKVESPVGTLFIAFFGERMSFAAFDRGERFEQIRARMEQRLHHSATLAEPPNWVREAVRSYFCTFVLDLDLLDTSTLTAFDRMALAQAACIPPGEVRSYGWIAEQIGRPQAARAVGRAMARNPLAPFLPCHRVVDSNGELHNYHYGLALKARILELEGYHSKSVNT